jgi:hypothetical protein
VGDVRDNKKGGKSLPCFRVEESALNSILTLIGAVEVERIERIVVSPAGEVCSRSSPPFPYRVHDSNSSKSPLDVGELRIVGRSSDTGVISVHQATGASLSSRADGLPPSPAKRLELVHRIILQPPCDYDDIEESSACDDVGYYRFTSVRDVDGLGDAGLNHMDLLVDEIPDLAPSDSFDDVLDEEIGEEGYELASSSHPPSMLETFTTEILRMATGACNGILPATVDCGKPRSVLRPPKRALSTWEKGDGAKDGSKEDAINRTVSFTSLEIREFNMTLGDHPSAVSGPPVMLDREPASEKRIITLDEYERMRGPRRGRKQLKLSFQQRRALLEKERGFTSMEIYEAWKEALLIRQQRQETLKRGPLLNTMDDFYESACRKFNRTIAAVGL